MGDAGEGLVDAESRLAERMEEREQEKRQARMGPVTTDPERARETRIPAAGQDRDAAPARSHHFRGAPAQLSQALGEIDKRLKASVGKIAGAGARCSRRASPLDVSAGADARARVSRGHQAPLRPFCPVGRVISTGRPNRIRSAATTALQCWSCRAKRLAAAAADYGALVRAARGPGGPDAGAGWRAAAVRVRAVGLEIDPWHAVGASGQPVERQPAPHRGLPRVAGRGVPLRRRRARARTPGQRRARRRGTSGRAAPC